MTSLPIVPLFAGVLVVALPSLASAASQTGAAPATASAPAEIAERARAAAKEGKLSYRVTTPAELKALLGAPSREQAEKDGDGEALTLQYPEAIQ